MITLDDVKQALKGRTIKSDFYSYVGSNDFDDIANEALKRISYRSDDVDFAVRNAEFVEDQDEIKEEEIVAILIDEHVLTG